MISQRDDEPESLGRDFIGFLVKELTKEKVLPTFLLVLGKIFITTSYV